MTIKLNPAQLEIDLLCKGLQIDSSCALNEETRIVSRSRNGLRSGLELTIPGDLKNIWTNVPIEEDFAHNSPYLLVKSNQQYIVRNTVTATEYPVNVPQAPAWYSGKTSAGTGFDRIGTLQGTVLNVSMSNTCSFWNHQPPLNCQFCTSGYCTNENELALKTIDDVVETALIAKQESGITFVLFNNGFHGEQDLERVGPYVKAIKEKVGLLVGIQMLPAQKLWKYDWLIDLGTDFFTFSYEFHNPEYFADLCPGKEKVFGQKTFFKALEYTTRKLGPGSCAGEIIAGVEPLQDTFRAIEYITEVGAVPAICIFRPLLGCDMEEHPAPIYENMVAIIEHAYRCCKNRGIPIGVAPNFEFSGFVNIDDGRYLTPRNYHFYWNEFLLKFDRMLAYHTIYKGELNPRTILTDEEDPALYRAGWKDATAYSELASTRVWEGSSEDRRQAQV